ncbi:MAG: hypothetical protein JKY60_09990 [Kordiimonadaceae bacterium]|nr:hypothetical protein [Kordiimonadaceae bacterium]
MIQAVPIPTDKVDTLLDLEAVTIGVHNKRTVCNFIMPILSRPDYEAIFKGLDGRPMLRMNEVAMLQAKVFKATIPELQRRKISETLDSFCRTILDNTQLLKKLHVMDISMQAKAKKLLGMLADTYFTEGECRTRAELQVRTYMKQPGFTRGLVAELARGEIEKGLLDFQSLLARAHIKRIETS